jgi:hypothetical protein
LTRAVTGALVGWAGGFIAYLAAMMVSFSFCNTHLESVSCTAATVESTETAARVVFLGGLAGTALVHGGLLRLCRLPRPWSVVVPEIVLTAGPFLIFGDQAVDGLLRLSGVAFAVVGVITGFRSRSSPHGEVTRDSP